MKLELLKNGLQYLFNNKENGFYVNLPYSIVERDRTKRNEEVRLWLQEFNCPYILANEDSAQDLLYYFGDLDMPIDGDDHFFIQMTENVTLHINASDEYHGAGEYTLDAAIMGMIINDETTKDEVKSVVDWIKEELKNFY